MDPFLLRESLRAGRQVCGTLVVSDSPRWPTALQTVGLDFIFIDTEHVALTSTQVATMCQLYRGVDLAPVVRVPSADPILAAKAIDMGAGGVVAPYVETVAQAKDLVGAVRWRPLKGRRLSARLDGQTLEPELESYLQQRNDANVLILNIESVPGMEALDEILSVDGIDAVLIGPHDLSCSLGLPEQYDHPQFLAACEEILQTARARGVGAGIHFTGEVAEQIRFVELGANMIIHSADVMLMTKLLKSELRALRAGIGEGWQTRDVGLDAI